MSYEYAAVSCHQFPLTASANDVEWVVIENISCNGLCCLPAFIDGKGRVQTFTLWAWVHVVLHRFLFCFPLDPSLLRPKLFIPSGDLHIVNSMFKIIYPILSNGWQVFIRLLQQSYMSSLVSLTIRFLWGALRSEGLLANTLIFSSDLNQDYNWTTFNMLTLVASWPFPRFSRVVIRMKCPVLPETKFLSRRMLMSLFRILI